MSAVNQRKIENALTKKGFVAANSHHKYFRYYTLTGKKTEIYTYVSHGNKEISIMLFGMMAKQCRLKSSEFKKFVDCTLSQNEYESLLKKQNYSF